MSSLGPQIAPATVYPLFDQGKGRASKGLDNLDREDIVLGALSVNFNLFSCASAGASLANTTVVAYAVLPGRCKISKIVVFCSAIEAASGNHKFNIVLGTGAYTQGSIPGNDNSSVPPVSWNAGGQAAATNAVGATPPGGGGICTNPAVPGNAMFAADVAFNTTNFPALTTGTGTGANYGQQLVPSSPDAVWPNQGILTLRLVTPGGGSISNLIISAVASLQPLNASFPASNFPIYATPEPTVDW